MKLLFLSNPTKHTYTGSDRILRDGCFTLLECKSYCIIRRDKVYRGGTNAAKFNTSKLIKHFVHNYLKEHKDFVILKDTNSI